MSDLEKLYILRPELKIDRSFELSNGTIYFRRDRDNEIMGSINTRELFGLFHEFDEELLRQQIEDITDRYARSLEGYHENHRGDLLKECADDILALIKGEKS